MVLVVLDLDHPVNVAFLGGGDNPCFPEGPIGCFLVGFAFDDHGRYGHDAHLEYVGFSFGHGLLFGWFARVAPGGWLVLVFKGLPCWALMLPDRCIMGSII